MRILYSHYLPCEDHPATRMIHAIADELRDLGHEVLVHRSLGTATDGQPRQGSIAQKTRFNWLRKRLWFAKALLVNREYMKRDHAVVESYQPDIVLCRNDAYCYSMPAVCKKKHIPLVTYSDAPAAFEARRFNSSGRWHPAGILEWVEKWVLNQSSAVITISNPAKSILERYHTNRPITVAHNGVDCELFRPFSKAEKDSSRLKEGAQRPLIAGFVGSFRAFHGADLLRDVIRLSANRNDLEWWLVGDGPERKRLEMELAGMPGVRFFGSRPAQEIPSLLASFDVSVIPHEIMGDEFYFCPLKILESMACGVPCVASKQGDIPELLDVGLTTELVEQPSPAKWIDAIYRALQAQSENQILQHAVRTKAEHSYTWAATANKVERTLHVALSNLERTSQTDRPVLVSEMRTHDGVAHV